MYKFILIVLVGAILFVGYSVLKDVDATPGESNPEEAYDVITQVQDSIKDFFGAVADYIGRESATNYEGDEGLASKFWQWAKALMQALGSAGIVLTVSQSKEEKERQAWLKARRKQKPKPHFQKWVEIARTNQFYSRIAASNEFCWPQS